MQIGGFCNLYIKDYCTVQKWKKKVLLHPLLVFGREARNSFPMHYWCKFSWRCVWLFWTARLFWIVTWRVLACLAPYIGGRTYLKKKMYQRSRNRRRLEDDKKEAYYWGHTDIGKHCITFRRPGHLAPGIYVPVSIHRVIFFRLIFCITIATLSLNFSVTKYCVIVLFIEIYKTL